MDSALAAALAGEQGLNNIWTAASDGELEKVKGFVAQGMDVNAQDETGYSPLHAATSYGHIEVSHLVVMCTPEYMNPRWFVFC